MEIGGKRQVAVPCAVVCHVWPEHTWSSVCLNEGWDGNNFCAAILGL